MVQTASDPSSTTAKTPRWGASDVLGWFLFAQVGGMLWISGLHAAWPGLPTERAERPMAYIFTGTAVLWFAYGAGPIITSIVKGNGPQADLGAWMRPDDLPLGLLVGVLTQVPVVWALYFPILRIVDVDPGAAARELADRITGPADSVLLIVMAGIMAPLVEEIFFRGFVLRFFLRHLSPVIAVVLQALLFAAVHFQLIQFPGLFVMGLVSGALAVRFGRLGPSWAMHVGFNGLTLGVLLFDWF